MKWSVDVNKPDEIWEEVIGWTLLSEQELSQSSSLERLKARIGDVENGSVRPMRWTGTNGLPVASLYVQKDVYSCDHPIREASAERLCRRGGVRVHALSVRGDPYIGYSLEEEMLRGERSACQLTTTTYRKLLRAGWRQPFGEGRSLPPEGVFDENWAASLHVERGPAILYVSPYSVDSAKCIIDLRLYLSE